METANEAYIKEENASMATAVAESGYISALKAELEALSTTSFENAIKLVTKEIQRQETGKNPEYIDLLSEKAVKINQKVRVPVEQFPQVNFVGKLLGPGGSTMKKLQGETGCRLAIFGKGSIRDKDKEEELRQQGGKYEHLNEDLHINVDVMCKPYEAYDRIAYAMNCLSQYMDPNFEDADQMQQMGFGMNGGGGPQRGRGGAGMRGGPRGRAPMRGAQRGRGAPRGRGGGPMQQGYQDFTSDDYSGGYGDGSYGGAQQGGGFYQGGRGGGPMRGMSRGAGARPTPYGRGGRGRGRGGQAGYAQ